jgi:hypothetical protein
MSGLFDGNRILVSGDTGSLGQVLTRRLCRVNAGNGIPTKASSRSCQTLLGAHRIAGMCVFLRLRWLPETGGWCMRLGRWQRSLLAKKVASHLVHI